MHGALGAARGLWHKAAREWRAKRELVSRVAHNAWEAKGVADEAEREFWLFVGCAVCHVFCWGLRDRANIPTLYKW